MTGAKPRCPRCGHPGHQAPCQRLGPVTCRPFSTSLVRGRWPCECPGQEVTPGDKPAQDTAR